MGLFDKIGFIGLGIMGAPMARNLVKAGFKVAVYNRTRSHTAAFADLGCAAASTPKALAEMSDTVIVMVADPAAVDEVLEGPQGVFAGFRGGNTLVNMGTVTREYTAALAKKCFIAGLNFLDCPVSGSKGAAEKAQLVILAGGKRELVDKFDPVLLSLGRTVIYAGEAPAGTALKLCINLIVAQMSSALAEAAALAEAQKLPPQLLFDALAANPALDCGYFRMKKDNILNKDFPPAFPLKHMLKDTRFMLAEAKKDGLELPVTAAVSALLERSYNTGLGGQDLTAMLKTLLDK